jgi:diaminohydroxyphosphoribosylaminopyrimidine deaminase/5-amino-6-(5-phosphoribosylamino)uracil reductase
MSWELILALRNELKEISTLPEIICVIDKESLEITNEFVEDSYITIAFDSSVKCKGNLFLSPRSFQIECIQNVNLDNETLSELKLYLPYILLPLYAIENKKCYAISHFAQTLDGKIASSSGDSKWIGNDENLIHAHKMRALCDAILIGAGTLESDNPGLNVRHVDGDDPVKVIIGGDRLDLNSFKAIDKNTIMFCQNHQGISHEYTKVCIEKEPNYNSHEVLQELYERGIKSVYIEGGAYTTSLFLKQNCIDQIQIHISPKILGSGTSSFSFEGINNMTQAKVFSDQKFIPIGEEVMFIGNMF